MPDQLARSPWLIKSKMPHQREIPDTVLVSIFSMHGDKVGSKEKVRIEMLSSVSQDSALES